MWRVGLDAGADALAAHLADDEHARAARFRFDRDRRRYVVARGRLREILGRYLDVPPERVSFQYGPQGKPELCPETEDAAPGHGLTFNLSHAGEHALVVVARGRRVGVDLEPVRALPDADIIAERFFSASEVAAYRALPEAARPAAFFACWTRKEAFVKALGDGLTHPLDTFDVSVAPEAAVPLLRVSGVDARAVGWDACDVPLGLDHAAAVAASGPGWHLVVWHDPALAPAPIPLPR